MKKKENCRILFLYSLSIQCPAVNVFPRVKTQIVFSSIGCKICVDIVTGEKLSSILVAISPLNLSSRRREDGEIYILALYRVHFNKKKHVNLV